MLKAVGSLLVASQKKLRLVGREGIELIAGKASTKISMAPDDMVLDGGANAHLKAGLVRLGPGSKPVATQGSLVQVTLPFTPVFASPTPLVLYGIILTGTPTVMA